MPPFISPSTRLKLRHGERRVLLMAGDFSMAAFALLFALLLWAKADLYQNFSLDFIRRTPGWFFLLPVIWIVLISGLYKESRAADWGETLRTIGGVTVVGLVLYAMVYFFVEPKSLPRLGVASFLAAVLSGTILWRFLYIKIFTAPQFMRRVLLVGGGETGQIMLRIIKELPHPPYLMLGIIDDDPQKIGTRIEGQTVLGGSDKLLAAITQCQATDLIVAISGKMHGAMFQTLLDAQEMGIQITRMPVAYEELRRRVPIRYLEADWILRSFVDVTRGNLFYDLAKRSVDIFSALVGLLIIISLFPFIAIAIVIESGFPIFYTQVRLGRGGQQYNIYKFRTMYQNAEPNGQPQWATENDRRTTKVGVILRKTHLDEFPQFVNVLRGEMSLIGPRAERPELVEWFQHHVPFYRARLLVKPGITGWAQVNQAYASTIEETMEKLEYDLYYIKHRGVWMDLQVAIRTPSMMLGLRGR